MGDGRSADSAVRADTGLVDVTTLSIDELSALPTAVLRTALDRVLADSGDVYNGFNNSI